MKLFRRWRRQRHLRQALIPEPLWDEAIASLPLLAGLSIDEQQRLRELVILFLREKIFEPVEGLELAPTAQLLIATQACLPILNLGLDWYDGWTAIIVYPGEFAHRREMMDEDGVIHQHYQVMSGEAWPQGGVIFSLADAEASGLCDGYNVVIHEMAHKLDMHNGEVNGFPPLHSDMQPSAWSAAFSRAFTDMNRRVDSGEDTPIDPYCTEDAGEFFAVLSEYFFEQPALLKQEYAQVYQQLSLFYRQDPATRPP
ncbi:MAG: zinc-dependent peptidase [Gammaproteobacteria bacterium]|nr:zinc-dependent peptidase [Gammaproteobacteria bacterium]